MKDQIIFIVTGLLAGTNLLQYIFFRASKTKATAEAESAVLENNRKELDIHHNTKKEILQQCDDIMKRMLATQSELQKYMMEVAELKATLVSRDQTILFLTHERDYYKSEYERVDAELAKIFQTN